MDLDEAIALVHAGRGVEAEQTLVAQLEAVRARHAAPSGHVARALYELAAVRMASGNLSRAVEPLREAASIRAADTADAEKQRLTYNMNLGEVQQALGDLAGAEATLREGLAAREVFYGRSHPGYAYGLQTLAGVLCAAGRLDDAFELSDAALDIFWNTGNPAVVNAMASRAPAAIARRVSAFDRASELPDELFAQLLTTVLGDRTSPDPNLRVAVLSELAGLAQQRGGDADLLGHVWAGIANAARDAGDHNARLAALDTMRTAAQRRGDREEELSSMLAFALALDEAGQTERADDAYAAAVARARAFSMSEQIVKALRNHGLFEIAHGRVAEGETKLAEAIRQGDQRSAERARTAIALGIRRQHSGDRDDARRWLREGVFGLEPFDRDALCGRSHLRAIESGSSSCGCGDMGEVLGDVVAEVVAEQLPQGLLESVRFGEGGDVQIRLARAPTGDVELQHLDVVMSHALAALRRSIAGS